jgi:hypothetical protein
VHEQCVAIYNLVAVQRVLQRREALDNIVDEPAAAVAAAATAAAAASAAAASVVSACNAANISNEKASPGQSRSLNKVTN